MENNSDMKTQTSDWVALVLYFAAAVSAAVYPLSWIGILAWSACFLVQITLMIVKHRLLTTIEDLQKEKDEANNELKNMHDLAARTLKHAEDVLNHSSEMHELNNELIDDVKFYKGLVFGLIGDFNTGEHITRDEAIKKMEARLAEKNEENRDRENIIDKED
jgi:hypothetical protein